MASVLAADDSCCQDLTTLSQQVGQVGAALDNIKQGCLTWGEQPVVRHSIRRGQKGLPISKGHKAASICHSEAPSSPILFHMQTERHWKPLNGDMPHRANIASGEWLLMRIVTFNNQPEKTIREPTRGQDKTTLLSQSQRRERLL